MGITDAPIDILVVGGSGFIGSAIAMHAVELGWRVDSLGLSIPSDQSKIAGVDYIIADITSAETLKFLSNKQYDYVINSGGYINHKLFTDGGEELLQVHFYGLVNLVKYIDRRKLKRFINIGSSDEYGDTAAPQAENIRENPIAPYSTAKVAATHFLQMLYRTEEFPSVSLRLFLCYGPGQAQNRFLPYLIGRCLEDDEIKTSPGEQLRDYCFIDDVVDAVFLSMTNDNANGRIFNIGSGRPISIKEVVERVVNIVGSGKPKFGAVPYRKGENMELYADVNLANKILSWSAKTTLDEGLIKTVSYYRN